MEIASNLYRVGNDIVAAYLVTTPEGITVIDAALPGHWSDLLAELKTLGRPIGDITGVILTHGDSDHTGLAERLRRDHGVPVYVHPADADRAKGGPVPKNTMGPWKLGAMLGFFAYALRKGLGAKHLTATVDALPGTTLDLPGAPQIIGNARALCGEHRGLRAARRRGVCWGCHDYSECADWGGWAGAGAVYG